MKILVVGGSGFLGKQCLNYLSANDVTSLGRDSLDVYDSKAVIEFLKQNCYDKLLFLAWPHTPPHNQYTHISFAKSALDFISAFAIANPTSHIVVTGSVHDIAPKNLYGLSKAYVREAILILLPEIAKQAKFCWVRLANVYGPGDHPNKLLSNMIQTIAKGEDFTLQNPQQLVDFVHVQNAARGIVEALLTNMQGDLNISSGNGYCLSDVKNLICAIINGKDSSVSMDESFRAGLSECINLLLGREYNNATN